MQPCERIILYSFIGENVSLSNRSLLMEDRDGNSNPLTLVYALSSTKQHGIRILRLGQPCREFTQADVNSKAMMFQHMGKEGEFCVLGRMFCYFSLDDVLKRRKVGVLRCIFL